MAIEHLQSGQIASVLPLGAALAGAGNVALFKSPELEVIRLVLPKGKTLPAHQVQGGITIQCLEGSLQVEAAPHGLLQLQAGDLLYLAGGTPHALLALEDSSALLTLALQ